MRYIWTAASIAAVAAATATMASAQTHVVRGGNSTVTMPTVTHIAPTVMRPSVTQTRGGTWNNGGVRGGGQVRPWSGQQGRWNGGRPNGGQWNGGGQWSGGRWNGGQWNGSRARWGGRINGRWSGGAYAPGGWAAYRQPYRGWALPSYWFAPTFFITDYSAYGLGAPPVGYNWTRYYDDAVLVDGRGRVYDNVSGLDWNRYEGGLAYDDGGYDDGDRYYANGVDDDYGPRGVDGRRDNGVGGAVIGGVVGGVAGNVIAGRGNRLPGTIVGAGVGAVAGAAIDRAEDRAQNRGRRYDDRGAPYGYPDRGPPPPPVGYGPGPGYPPGPGYGPGPGYPPPPIGHHGGGYTTQVYSAGGYGYGYGYGYYGGTTTTVTVLPTTTTTTETITVYDDVRTRARTWRKPVYRPTKVLRRTPSKILNRNCNC